MRAREPAVAHRRRASSPSPELSRQLVRGALLCVASITSLVVAFVAIELSGDTTTIGGAGSGTAARLRIHSVIPIPGNVRAWLLEYHGEAPDMQVAGVFMRWSIEHRAKAEKLAIRFTPNEQQRLAERVAFATCDRGAADEFLVAFRGTSSPLFAAAVEGVRRQQEMIERAMREHAGVATAVSDRSR